MTALAQQGVTGDTSWFSLILACFKLFLYRDRHANIGKGKIGEEGFRKILNCPHFVDLPLILETPPHKELGEDGYRSHKTVLVFYSICKEDLSIHA